MIFPTKEHFINIHTHKKASSPKEWILRNAFFVLPPQTLHDLDYAISVGLHPWFATEAQDISQNLAAYLELENVLAIGEIGLDRVNGPNLELQKQVFQKQLAIAEAHQKPVIIHAVKAYADVIPYLKQFKMPFILHGFNGNLQQLKQLISYPQVYFSFGKDLLKPDCKAYQAFQEVPANRFFLETDIAHLQIDDLYQQAAKIRKIDIAQLKKQVFYNFEAVFKRLTP
ncbi:TatD family hydrolase [Pedobacter glucosidilyticus]|uniref:TatD family hydrolase n=1 Tax=Pedobacter glucosidilyticus TaxID=1122941 RepID=UPI0004285464|nr:TatD family hydrolase [Pedobacter glucosidilyticus]